MSNFDVTIQIQLKQPHVAIPEARLKEAVGWLLREHHAAPTAGVAVVIVDDDESRRLNRQFREVDAPTDVLSFPNEPVPGEEEPYLGDLVLALPYIRRQAEAEQHSVDDEVILAVIHGTLHLLGYDHDSPARQSAMWTAQAAALKAMAVHIDVPLFDFSNDDESA